MEERRTGYDSLLFEQRAGPIQVRILDAVSTLCFLKSEASCIIGDTSSVLTMNSKRHPFGLFICREELGRTKWGLEDILFADALRANDLIIVRAQEPLLVHLYHPKAIWKSSLDGINPLTQ